MRAIASDDASVSNLGSGSVGGMSFEHAPS
jgi:hypothetical protein